MIKPGIALGPVWPEIDEHTSMLIVGLVALSLAWLTNHFSDSPLQSISASYHEGGLSRNIFVGFICAIAAFLFSYNGKSLFSVSRCG
jgi:L-asparagine transporter-like permease